ncbi:hypothetical protein AWZ03_011759 [Drosophila navojoa]|uniref:Peptidase S1 domain-containing protein n=1 Tax=Drosophila navojoa TaxID=7232 RepID=A0A484B0R3_DRONA|nr:hypothetical protein AWZ03_011759 [Drosophila navojoa]
MDGADARTGLVTIEEFPYLGSLRSRKKESELAGSGYLCGATLIRNRVLVTTAECAQGKNPMDILGVVGATYLQGLSTTSKVLEIESIRCHGLYKRGRPSYNIALAFTAEDTLPIKGKLGYVPIAMKRVRPHTRCVGVSWAANTDVLSNQPIALPNYSVASPECYKTIQAVGRLSEAW